MKTKNPLIIAALVAALSLMPTAFAQSSGAGADPETVRIYEALRAEYAQKGIPRTTMQLAKEAIAARDARRAVNSAQAAAAGTPEQTGFASPGDARLPATAIAGGEKGNIRGFIYAGSSMLYNCPQGDGFDSSTLWGGVLGGGIVWAEKHYFSLEIGGYYLSETKSWYDYYSSYERTQNTTVIPVWFSYNYIFHLTAKRNLSIRVGPTLGIAYVQTELEDRYGSASQGNTTFGGGINVGITWEFLPNWFLDVSERFVATSSYKFFDQLDTGIILSNQFTISAGVKF